VVLSRTRKEIVMIEEPSHDSDRRKLTRAELLQRGLAGGLVLSSGGVLAPVATAAHHATGARPKTGGTLRLGAEGGGSADTLDPHQFATHASIARMLQLYEPLMAYDRDYLLGFALATEIIPNATATRWTVRLRSGVEFHNGKTLGPADAIFSLRRILDPKGPKTGAIGLGDIDLSSFKRVDRRTFSFRLKRPYSAIPQELGQFFNNIVPVGFNIAKPVGTGPFMFKSFTPGQQSIFVKNPNYWRAGQPHLNSVVIIDLPDDTARVNAFLGGQVDAIDSVPFAQIQVIRGNPAYTVQNARTGGYLPFQMRVDVQPFSDVRVRQALRLIVDRKQMIDQALNGQGVVGNDLYGRYDPAYASDLPQRQQDLAQAKSLLASAGQSNLSVELVTSPLATGIVEAAQVFQQQAKGAGVTVTLNQVDVGTYYGPNFLKWTFGQDFWLTRNYLPQVAVASLPKSPVNETHWANPQFTKLILEARRTISPTKRTELLHAAQAIEYHSGGLIIWCFNNQIDAYNRKFTGFAPSRSGIPLGDYAFRNVSQR
jgi:peptide/nickel transport system substrate-binding protein